MKRILVIEDETPLRESIVMLLSMEGFESFGAATGSQGIQLARERLPDLVIADIMMPEMDGYAVLEALRQRSVTATIPFIFLTARTSREDIRRGMELGADDYIPKPFRSKELIAAVMAQFEKQATLENARLRALSHYLVQVQETERGRIAHELHDDIGQLLSGLKVTLSMSKRLPSHTVGAMLDEAEHIVDAIAARLKHLSGVLRPAILDALGLLPALDQFLERHPLSLRGQIEFTHHGLDRRFPTAIETTIYRIVQKTLGEMARSSPEAEIQLKIGVEHDAVCVEITDCSASSSLDLPAAFSHNPAAVFVEMVERVGLMGGQLVIESAPGTPTRVSAQLPLNYSGDDLPALPARQVVNTIENTRTPPLFATLLPRSDTPANAYDDAALRIVLADTHDWIRQGLRLLLETEPEFALVGELHDLAETLPVCLEQRPDVLVIDPATPEYNAFDLIAQVKRDAPQTQILVLSMHAETAYVAEAFRSGATGYALKEVCADDLLHAVRDVAAGQRYLSPDLVSDTIDAYLAAASASEPDPPGHDVLTQREVEVLQLVAEGLRNNEIAEQLSISPRTVETHRANMMRKLDLHTQANLIRFAIDNGLTGSD